MKKITISILFSLLSLLSMGQTPPCNNPSPPSPGSGRGISNVTLDILNHTTPIEEGYTVEYDSAGTVIPDLGKCENYVLTVTVPIGSQRSTWIDWNEDGDFDDPEESYVITSAAANQYFYDITVPFDAAPGNKIMRVASGFPVNNDPCINSVAADFEDYRINVVENNMQIDSIVVEPINSCFIAGDNCQPVLSIAVHTTGILNPITITGFNFSSNGSTDPANDLSDASVIFIGDTSEIFSCNTIFGTLGTPPAGGFNITGNQVLNPSNCRNIYYFWLVYDIAPGATASNLIDAECVDATTIGGPPVVTPIVGNPTGTSRIASTTEICDNGIDDDCDGLVDCFDPDCAGIGDCISEISNFFYGLPNDTCPDIPLPNPNIDLFKEWIHVYTQSLAVRFVVIGDLDGDNISEIVLTDSGTNLIVLDGRTGLVKRNIPATNYNNSTGLIADADGNGSGEIYWTSGSNRMFCYDYVTNTTLWDVTYTPGSTSFDPPISIADFNGDGTPEIYTDGNIINTLDGSIMSRFSLDFNNIRPIAIDILPDTYCSSCSGLELVVGTQIFTVSINADTAILNEVFSFESNPNLVNINAGSSRKSAAADINNDNLLDIVTVSNTMIFSWDPRTLTIIDSISLDAIPIPDGNDDYITSPVSIDDIDNDGDLDFVFVVMSNIADIPNRNLDLVALDNNFNLLWNQQGMADFSISSFPTIFDLDCDGNKEVVFRTEAAPPFNTYNWVHVLDANSGSRLDSIFCLNRTVPTDVSAMIADVDNDGEVEIIATGFSDVATTQFELMVIGNRSGQWACGRNMWNQQNYHPSFVNDDLTIPQFQQNHGVITTINTWGNQTTFRDTNGNYACPLPDLNVNIDSIFNSTCDTVGVDITVCNIGRKAIGDLDKFISYYNGDPLTGGTLIRTDLLDDQPDTVGSCLSFSTTVFVENHPFDLYVVVNDSGNNPLTAPNFKIKECNLDNNFDNAIPTNLITVSDTIRICDGDSVFLNNAFQTTAGVYSDTTQNMECDSIISTTLILSPRPNPVINPQDPMCLNENPIQLIVTDTGGTWIGSGIIDSVTGTFNPQLAEVGINNIYYITTCGDSVSIDITVDVCDLFIPNTFTPNGDNTNDTFFPEGSDISEKDYIFSIYNRWGELIFKSDIPGEGWDGNFKGKTVSNNVFVWQLNYRDSNDNLQRITGRVSVIR